MDEKVRSRQGSRTESSESGRSFTGRRWFGRLGLAGLLVAGLWFACERRTHPIRDTESTLTADEVDAQVASELGPLAAPKVTEPTPTVKPSLPLAVAASSETLTPLNEEQIIERRAQIKASLAGLYTAQRAFHAEFDRYSTDLMALGWTPASATLPGYIGFTQAFEGAGEVDLPGGLPDGEIPTRLSTHSFVDRKADNDRTYRYDSHSNVPISDLDRYCRRGCSASRDRFEMIAAFNLDADPTLDVWLINESKELIHVVDDERE